MTGADVVSEARSFLGVRWVHQGRSRSGVDCIGLPLLVREGLGLKTPAVPADYTPAPKDESMLDFCRAEMLAVRRADLEPGDLLVMNANGMRHMGIVGDYVHGGLSLIHAHSKHPRRVTEHRLSDEWMKAEKMQVLGCFRFREVAQ